MSVPAAKHAAPTNDPPACVKCGDEYFLRDGCEVTAHCDPCAQEVVADLFEVLQRIRKRLEHGPLTRTAKGRVTHDSTVCTLCIVESALRRALGEDSK